MKPKLFKIPPFIGLIFILALLLAACQPEPTLASTVTQPVATGTKPAPTNTQAVPTVTQTALTPTTAATTAVPPTLTFTTAPSVTPGGPTITRTLTRVPNTPTATLLPPPDYLDDRSTPTGLIKSFFNAINRKEYLRAYAYYSNPSQTVGLFSTFFAGYQNTVSVTITLGTIGGDNGAGQIYYSVPALLKAVNINGTTYQYAACYILHLSQPGIQGTPPFAPMGINVGKAIPLANNADLAAALANACSGPDFPTGRPINPTPQTNTQDISQNNYLDERSSALNVIKSLLNAINRKEYLRAYSYWETPSSSVGPYPAYEQGFATTAAVEATFGAVTSDAGAGQLYYRVPLVERVTTTASAIQTYAGCYIVHVSQPALQDTPPFRPLGIFKGSLTQVNNNADLQSLLAAACNQP